MEDILSRLVRGVRKPTKHKRALFLCGASGSGKTTYIKRFLDDAKMTGSYVYVNPDDLPERDMLGYVLHYVAEQGYSIVVDATCRNKSLYLPFFEVLKQKGYRITIGIMYVSLKTSLSRVAMRTHQPVPPDVVRDIYAHLSRTVESYMNMPELFLYSHGRLVFQKKDDEIICPDPSTAFYFPLSKYCQKV